MNMVSPALGIVEGIQTAFCMWFWLFNVFQDGQRISTLSMFRKSKYSHHFASFYKGLWKWWIWCRPPWESLKRFRQLFACDLDFSTLPGSQYGQHFNIPNNCNFFARFPIVCDQLEMMEMFNPSWKMLKGLGFYLPLILTFQHSQHLQISALSSFQHFHHFHIIHCYPLLFIISSFVKKRVYTTFLISHFSTSKKILKPNPEATPFFFHLFILLQFHLFISYLFHLFIFSSLLHLHIISSFHLFILLHSFFHPAYFIFSSLLQPFLFHR